MEDYRILLADDHLMVRQALRRVLEEFPGVEVVGEAGDGLELLEMLERLPADLAIVDISMPRLQGLEAVRAVRRSHPGVKTLILTMHRDNEYLRQAMVAGADGYLLKEDCDRELLEAINAIREGGVYISPLFSEEVSREWRRHAREGRGRQ